MRATCRWRDRSRAAAKQGALGMAAARFHQSCEEARKDSAQNLRGSTALPTPRFRLIASELRKNNFLCFKATQFERLSYGSSRKEVHLDTQQKYVNTYVVIVVQSLSHVRLFTHQTSLSLTISRRLPKFTSIASWTWCISSSYALFSFCLQSFPASGTFPMSRLFPSVIKILGL